MVAEIEREHGVSEIIAQFTDKQREAFEALFQWQYILYGGARGGGKSFWLRWVCLLMLIYWYREYGLENVVVGLFCETYPDLRDRQINKIKKEFPQALGVIKETKTHGLGFYLSEENGGGVIALRNLDKPDKYQSAEFAMIAVDELTKSTFDTFEILRGSKRWPGLSHTLFVGATNPGGIGHGWVKDLWIDGNFPANMRSMKQHFKFIQSLPSDNPHLDEFYWEELNTLSDDLRRAWVQGDWDVFKGQAFANWRKDKHTCKPFVIPTWWPKWRAIDWGFREPFCCLWFSQDPVNGRIYVYRELYERELTDRQQAQAIVGSTAEDEKITVTYADPAMWIRKNMDGMISSTADEYKKYGVPLAKADNNRLSGKRKLDRALSNLPDGDPGIVFFTTCHNCIRTIPLLPYDKIRVEDVDTDAEDHAYDTVKYGLSKVIKTKEPDNDRRSSRTKSRWSEFEEIF
jgi:phage terminase large subunit